MVCLSAVVGKMTKRAKVFKKMHKSAGNKNSAGKEMAKGAVINLVDLAGRYVILF